MTASNTADILLIEDDPMVSEAIRDPLQDAGYRVDPAPSGEDGLKKARGSAYRLVFLDLRLPGMDGIQVLERLRDLDPLLPVIIITGHGSLEDARRAVRLGARGFVMKPLTIERLVSLAREALPPPGSAPIRVLVVEDDPMVADALLEILRSAGHQALHARSREEATPHIRSGLFDVVVSDLRLPGASGMDLIRDTGPSDSIAMVLISGLVSPEEAAEAMRLGAHDVLQKPFTPDDLLEAVAGAHRDRRRAEMGLQPGICYRVEGESHNPAYHLFAQAIRLGMGGLCISRLHPMQVARRYGLRGTPIVWLGRSDTPNSAGMSLGTLADRVSRVVESETAPVILLDGAEYLVAHHGFPSVLRTLEILREQIAARGAILLLPLDPRAFEPREYSLLRRLTEPAPPLSAPGEKTPGDPEGPWMAPPSGRTRVPEELVARQPD